MKYRESYSNTSERPKLRAALKVGGSLASAALLASVLTSCSSATEITHDVLKSAEDYALDPEITAVTIADGANVRITPDTGNKSDTDSSKEVGPKTLLVELDLDESVTLKTEAGVATATDFDNGDWYGIPLQELLEDSNIATQIPEHAVDQVEAEENPIIWISSQRARIARDTDS